MIDSIYGNIKIEYVKVVNVCVCFDEMFVVVYIFYYRDNKYCMIRLKEDCVLVNLIYNLGL